MSIVRIISALIFLGTLTAFGMGLIPDQSNALAARSADEAVLARDAATSRNDIDLTNSCIEAGESKEHCLCVTKVFKYEMSLREYKAAIKLYQSALSDEPTMRSSVKMALKQFGYSDNDIKSVDNLQRNLSGKTTLQNRCAIADTYFSQ